MNTVISYEGSEHAWLGYEAFIADLIDQNCVTKVCDVGGGANPFLREGYVAEKRIDCAILDISSSELSKAPPGYCKIVADIASAQFSVEGKFDLVFSRMLAEHISDARQFHTNVRDILVDKGLAVHFFPTLYAFPFMINYLMPERLSQMLLNLFAPRDDYQHGKFPAYYAWCRGPTRGQLRRFTDLGYEVVHYKGFFGHGDYYNRISTVKMLHEYKTKLLLKHPVPLFTSFAYLVLRKA